ncbi:hypothetical protein LCGC14_2730810 [marine sediment metagenome]|uniref:Uncharacterized protein n=1 Tax=marine sediment metagenome TaxID=412755 RepID=A0A0F8Z7C6_9ZZZZ
MDIIQRILAQLPEGVELKLRRVELKLRRNPIKDGAIVISLENKKKNYKISEEINSLPVPVTDEKWIETITDLILLYNRKGPL